MRERAAATDVVFSTATLALRVGYGPATPCPEAVMRNAIIRLGGALLGCSDPRDSMSIDFRAEPIGEEEPREWPVARIVMDHPLHIR